MDSVAQNHIERLRNQTIDKFTLDKIPQWLQRHTKVNGNPFSFQGHEYQRRILEDTSQEVVVIKSSQMGITEISIRLALALCAVVPHYTVIYTLPTAGFAMNVMNTRVDPVIRDSDFLRELLDKNTDNSEIKQLGSSFLYLKGAASGNAPISIPAHHLIHDELDFCDLGIIEQYQSRLTHSPYKRKHKFSTPTLPNFGIHAEFMQSRRHFEFLKCSHCGHRFIPDYYEHVKVPEWDKPLDEITRRNLHTTRWKEARLLCPHCGKVPDQDLRFREWVLENTEDNYVAAGYNLSPFSAPAFITPSALIQASTNYPRKAQFVNFALGKPMEDSETTLTKGVLEGAIVARQEVSPVACVMGIDVGLTCTVTVVGIMQDNLHVILHTEEVHYSQIKTRHLELKRKYRIRMSVIDMLPYTETVLDMQGRDPNLYAAVYVDKKSLELQSVASRQEDKEEGLQGLRQVNVNRNKAFDVLMEDIKSGNIVKFSDANDQTWVNHLMDMKRVHKLNRNDEVEYVWVKSQKGEDHFHHSLAYAEVAARMVDMSYSPIILPSYVGTFKYRPKG